MKYYGLKGRVVSSRISSDSERVEEFSIDGDLYDLAEYLTRGLEESKKIYFIASSFREPLIELKKLAFVKGLGSKIESTMFNYLYGTVVYFDDFLAKKIPSYRRNCIDEHCPGLLKIKDYISMVEFLGYSSADSYSVWIILYCVKNCRLLGTCTIKVPKGEYKLRINIRYARKGIPIEEIKGLYTAEELINILRSL